MGKGCIAQLLNKNGGVLTDPLRSVQITRLCESPVKCRLAWFGCTKGSSACSSSLPKAELLGNTTPEEAEHPRKEMS